MKHFTHDSVTRRAKKDGRNWQWRFWPIVRSEKPIEPKKDQDLPAQFETELIQAGEHDAAQVAEKWQRLDSKLKPEYCQALSHLENAKKHYSKENQEAEAALAEFHQIEQKFQELDAPNMDPKWSYFWLFIIGLAEFPLNGLVFSIFGADRIETYIMAATMCLAIPIAAHFWGQSLRQEIKSKTNKAFLVAIPVVIFGLLAVLAFLRGKFFEAMNVQQVLGITIKTNHATILFIIINTALFFIASIISYEDSHPNHRLYHTLCVRLKEALQKSNKESQESKIARQELEKAELYYQKIRQIRQKAFDRHTQEAKTIKETTDWLVAAYRASNLSARFDIPPCFKIQPQAAEIPVQLQSLLWECEKQKQPEDQPE